MIYLTITLFLWFPFWSAQAGRSMRSVYENLDNWQDIKDWYSQIPEMIIALSIGIIAATGWQTLFDYDFIPTFCIFVISSAVAYAGKQSATWAYLRWEGHKGKGRDSTMRGVNDWLAARLGYKLGDEGYSWVWAFTKGMITTLPFGGVGAIFQPLWRELASHAENRLPYDPNMWMELADGMAYASAALIFVTLIF